MFLNENFKTYYQLLINFSLSKVHVMAECNYVM